MEPHRSHRGWFWAWTAAGFGLVVGFLAIFGIGPFLLPFVTLLVGVCARRRAAPAPIAAGVAVALLGIVATFAVSIDAFLLTPLATLAIGLSPASPRGVGGIARVVLLAAVVLVAIPLALVAFAVAVAGRLDAEASGAIAGAALGGPPTPLFAAVAGVAAFPLLRRPSGTPLRG